MFGAKIKIEKDLYERVAKAAEQAGYASTEEFIIHVLERETAKLAEAQTDKEVEEQLRGLGYIE
jgi:hypothetical protein